MKVLLHHPARETTITGPKRVGQVPRLGRVATVHGSGVDVVWDDGHHSTVSGDYLFPVPPQQSKV